MDGRQPASRLEFGPVTLIPDERLVLKDGQPLALTPKAFDLLAILAANPGRLLTKDYLMKAVWPDTAVEESNLAYHVFAIRKALGDNPDSERYIETVPKRGYRFISPVVRVESNKLKGHPSPLIHAGAPRVQFGIGLRRWSWGLVSGVLLGALIVLLGMRQLRHASAETTGVRFQEPVAGRLAESGTFSISPDGSHLLFAAEGADGVLRLWVRMMSALQPVPLPGTEVFAIIPPVVWSPDGSFVGFDPTGVLKKVSLSGGAPQTVCELPATAVGGGWNRAGDILLGNAFGGLMHCPASGGQVSIVTTADQAEQERHIFPSFLPDERHFLYLKISRTKPELSGIYVGELGRATPIGNRLIATGFDAAYVEAADSGPGLIVFARDGGLFAQRFDDQRLELIGEAVPIVDRIGSYLDYAFFAVSTRTLVYRAPEPNFQLTWFDRQGREIERVGAPARFSGLALSPNGDRAIVVMHAPDVTADQDLWLFDLARPATPRRMTFDPMLEISPVWSSNDQFVFGSGGGGSGVYRQTIDGRPQLLFRTGRPELPTSMTPDGKVLLYTTPDEAPMGGDVGMRLEDGAAAIVRPFLRREKDQWQAQISPDRRWVAYASNEGGPNEVFVSEFRVDSSPGSGTAGEGIRISDGGGFAPRWRHDGRELFYLTTDGSVMAVEVDAKRGFVSGTAKRLFKVSGVIPEWGVTADGARFLFAVPVTQPPPFSIVQDWQATLPR